MEFSVRAPGRVNLIGEHTDYNQGYVLPIAIELELVLEFCSRNDHLLTVSSDIFNETVTTSINYLKPLEKEPEWIDYVKSIYWIYINEGFNVTGADMLIKSSIPRGLGLSSSAALELAVAAALNETNKLNIGKKEMALLCHKAENHYIGVRCGIMDQFAVALARKGNALFIDCLTTEYRHVPFNMEDYIILIVDSRVDRALASSAYNRRREECEAAVACLSQITGDKLTSLRDVKATEIRELRQRMPANLYRRSLFITEENERVLMALEALEKEDFMLLGNLFNSSHDGLRDLFEVSCDELNVIASTASAQSGVMGARITGAGFGGCVIVLLNKNSVEQVKEAVNVQFYDRGWRQPHYYLSDAMAGLSIQ